jgi:hypothetical protein
MGNFSKSRDIGVKELEKIFAKYYYYYYSH